MIALLGLLAVSAHATPGGSFGPATAATSLEGSPTVTLDVTPTTGTVDLDGLTDDIFSQTGDLVAASSGPTSTTDLTFSNIPGVTIPNAISSQFLYPDGNGGDFEFDLSSVETISYTNDPGVSTSISLYESGMMADENSNPAIASAFSPTSITLTLNQTGSSAFSLSDSISNPPAPIPPPPPPPLPEPATLALLGSALAGFAIARRRRHG